MDRLLITGAAGHLGGVCRARLGHLARVLRLSDREMPGAPADNEELVSCDLADAAAVRALVEGCDGIVHLGGMATEAPWDAVRDSNIEGIVNLYEAVRKAGTSPRILFASTNHTIGFHPRTETLGTDCTFRPDGLYGASKVFGEAIAMAYHDKFGIETARVRIGACFEVPRDRRMLSTWMSFDDFVRLIERVFAVDRLGCPVIWGVSDNDAAWWDNSAVDWLGWERRDNSERFRAEVEAREDAPLDPVAEAHMGGTFCSDGIHEA